MSTSESEVKLGKRFEFGKNWKRFLSHINEDRIKEAESSIRKMLGSDRLDSKTVIDIGSGSGLFSLAMRRLGASVYSFDYDQTSVACTTELRSRFFANDPSWKIADGSILDRKFVESLGSFDLVYSWGVLHHTGDMWTSIDNAASLVNKNGTLFIALYNDQGNKSKFWKQVKKAYCSGVIGRIGVTLVFVPYFSMITIVSSILNRKNLFSEYKRNRGMSITHDWFDWLGGLPFEVAKVEGVFNFMKVRGFRLENIVTNNGVGCNQFVFVRE